MSSIPELGSTDSVETEPAITVQVIVNSIPGLGSTDLNSVETGRAITVQYYVRTSGDILSDGRRNKNNLPP